MVIDAAALEAAARARRKLETCRWPHRVAGWLAPLAAATVAALAVLAMLAMREPLELGPLESLLAHAEQRAVRALLAGIAALLLGGLLLYLHRGRGMARLPRRAAYLTASVIGAAAVLLGVFGMLGANSSTLRYLDMPARSYGHGLWAAEAPVVDATVVIVAGAVDGDARDSALGMGVVVAAEDRRAWVVTNRHVVDPRAAVSSPKEPADIAPVWLQLADGRHAPAHVRWLAPPPLDLALLEVGIEDPPAAVVVARAADAVAPGERLYFLPNPYRNGWLVHHGLLLHQKTYDSPAGACSLLFTDLPVIPGDSGGGLYNEHGELVGLNTWTRFENGPKGISLPAATMELLVDAIERDALPELLVAPALNPNGVPHP